MSLYYIKPSSIAALVTVERPDGTQESAIFMSAEKGIVVGPKGRPMTDADFPPAVQEVIRQHFAKVFALEHEGRHSMRDPSPRALYVEQLQRWWVDA